MSGDDGAESLPLPFYDVGHRGASAIYASAHDLVTFGMFHLKERLDDGTSILKRGSIDAMQRIQTHELPTDGYGLAGGSARTTSASAMSRTPEVCQA